MRNLDLVQIPQQSAMHDGDEEYSFVGQLAWDYCKLNRLGKNPSKDMFLRQLRDHNDREEFELLISLDELVEQVTEHQFPKTVS